VKTSIRLKDGETNMLAGLIRDDERRTHRGIPGLSDIPGVGRLFGHSRDERQQTDVILMLTPRIVRVLELSEDDLRAFQMGRNPAATGAGAGTGRFGGAPAGGVELPLPDELDRPDIQPDVVPQPGGVNQPARPLMPPTPPQPAPNPGQTPPPR
jgi:general secretion pathway protein D